MGKLLSGLLLLATVAALYNVYGDNAALVSQAESVACGGTCVRLLRAERTPIRQSFTFQTSVRPAASREVHCTRALLLVGGYRCESP